MLMIFTIFNQQKPIQQLGILLILMIASVYYGFMIYSESTIINGGRYFSLYDDPMISMRYARNLSAGLGLVWNPGEQPVEGFSNFLWTMIMAVVHLLPVSDAKTSLVMKIISLVILIANSVLASTLAYRLSNKNFLVYLFTLLSTLFYWPMIHWGLNGFEVGLLSLIMLIILFIIFIGDQAAKSLTNLKLFTLGLLCSMAILTRLDSALLVIGVIGYLLLRQKDWLTRKNIIIYTILPTVFIIELFFYCRWQYYGQFLPNTYFLKVTGLALTERINLGLAYLSVTLSSHLLIVSYFVILSFLTVSNKFQPFQILLVFLFFCQVGYTLYLGGDTWERKFMANRYLTTTMPEMFILASMGMQILLKMCQRWKKPLASIVTSMAFLANIIVMNLPETLPYLQFHLNPHHETGELFHKIRTGVYLNEHARPDSKIAEVWAGALPYFARRTAIDLLGKNDMVIARSQPHNTDQGHNKWNYRYSIGTLKPDFITSLYAPTAQDLDYLKQLGYQKDDYGIYVIRR